MPVDLSAYTDDDLRAIILLHGGWQDWMQARFPALHAKGYGARHSALWDWSEALEDGVEPPARIEVWPRGGGKSSTMELICCRLAVTLRRRFALYVCSAQHQADYHVRSIATLMGQAGIHPALSTQGRPKAWRRDQLSTAQGFHVAGYGLDTAMRGIKIDQYRPDLIILDDVDSEDDSLLVTDAKVASITQAVLPTGTADCGVVVVQNLVHANGVVARLAQGRAEYLLHRHPVTISPAVEGMEVEPEPTEEGMPPRWRIVAGQATWSGQSLDDCKAFMDRFGLEAFLRECQHHVTDRPEDPVFDLAYLEELLPTLPPPIRRCEPGENGLCGTLEVWERPQEGVEYVIGADVSLGLKRATSDESTAEVLRVDTGAQVASYYGKPDNKSYAIDLNNLAYTYNEAEVACESNEMGRVVNAYLQDYGARIWFGGKGTRNAVTPDQDSTGGFRTGEGSKALTDSELRSALVECRHGQRPTVIRSRRVVEEMQHYVYLPDGGRGNQPGYRDDHVRSYGIAYYVVKRRREDAAGVTEAGEQTPWQPRYQAEYSTRRAMR